jgi:DNA repair photolyase
MSKRITYGPIYKPAALAGEYGAWALNIYTGCPHRCAYCYVPGVMHTSRENWQAQPVRPRVTPEQVRKGAQRMRSLGLSGRVFLCFTCDPYGADQAYDITREVIRAITVEGLGVTVLTKAGPHARRDMDLLAASDSEFWVTLATMDPDRAAEWEHGAALPRIRLDNLAVAKGFGIPTAVSLEPVIWPSDALKVIRAAGQHADVVHVGKLNHGATPVPVDWRKFCQDAKAEAAEAGTTLKFKSSLEEFATCPAS